MTVRKARIMYELHLPILMLAQLSLSKKGAAGCRVGINCFVIIEKQAERLKSRERRPEVDRLTGLLAQWLIGSMVDRLDG